jgi:hypothetical protein
VSNPKPYPSPAVMYDAITRTEAGIESLLLDMPGAVSTSTGFRPITQPVCSCGHALQLHADTGRKRCSITPSLCGCSGYVHTYNDHTFAASVRVTVQEQP